jgi:hypothetical protein
MQVFLDQQPLESEPPPPETLAEWAALASLQARSRDRVIVGINCDGQPVGAERLDSLLDEQAEQFHRVEFNTCRTATLAGAALGQAAEVLAQLCASHTTAAELLHKGEHERAIGVLQTTFAGWSQVQQAVAKSSQLLDWSLDDMTLDDEPVNTTFQKLAEVLGEVRQALENQDYVLLADLLQYEFGPLATRWQRLLNHMRRFAEGAAEV